MRTPRSSLTWASVLAVWLTMGTPVTAQEEETPSSQSQSKDCGIDPNQPDSQATPDDDELSGKLDDCNGVLEPPSTGDPDIIEPAPPVGRTPVIRPEQIPEQESGDSL